MSDNSPNRRCGSANFPSDWEETARSLMPREIVVVKDWDQVVSAVLHGYSLPEHSDDDSPSRF